MLALQAEVTGLHEEMRGLEAGGLRLADQLASTQEQLEEAAMAHGALQVRSLTAHNRTNNLASAQSAAPCESNNGLWVTWQAVDV